MAGHPETQRRTDARLRLHLEPAARIRGELGQQLEPEMPDSRAAERRLADVKPIPSSATRSTTPPASGLTANVARVACA